MQIRELSGVDFPSARGKIGLVDFNKNLIGRLIAAEETRQPHRIWGTSDRLSREIRRSIGIGQSARRNELPPCENSSFAVDEGTANKRTRETREKWLANEEGTEGRV